MTKIFGHRGAAGHFPENTMLSFQAAYECGADGIELDVHKSKDGELVVIHDEKINRTTNGKGYVKDHTYDELKSFNAAVKWPEYSFQVIPRLEDVLEWIAKKPLYLNIELKNNVLFYRDIEEKLVRLLRKHKLTEQIILSSFNHDSMLKIARTNPEYEVALLLSDKMHRPWEYANRLNVNAIHPKWYHVNKRYLQRSRQYNVTVRPYTVNRTNMMKQLILNGCDALITDLPDKAVKLRDELLLH
ncbi:glycerophosphodiester phosphodiesterase [Bacillus solimangrovi]|uniref:GP-PDE domain-containing protein n=1 Tax=Bacillus solimangrovi TaxID=1305675 RepID=A0A1E5LKA0_9BACI|nr:glycerophosphodiester phosphodiesterase [Bacillus solimangrovi]OEH94504.1 hypothetical protein BFG57_07470 [Bacillus solimangrovi]